MTSSHSAIRYSRFLGIVAILLALVAWQVGDTRAALNLNGALQFDGVDDHVTFGNPAELRLATFTLEVWFNWTGGGNTAFTGGGGIYAIPLVTKGHAEAADGTPYDINYFLGIEDGKLAADFEEGATGTTPGLNHPVRGTTTITTNTWHHAAATYDGTTWNLYLDGALEQTLVVGQPPRDDSFQRAGLGASVDSTGYTHGSAFEGLLDEARIWDYARNQTEIQATKDVEITVPTAGLVGCWNLNEGTGTTAGDSSGNGLAGTLMNGPVWITPDAVAPAAPTGLTAAPGNALITLSWDAHPEADVAGYNLYGSTTSPVSTVGTPLNGSNLIRTTSYTDAPLVNGTTYYYALTATDWSDNVSAATGEVSAAPDASAGAALAFDGVDDYVTFGVAPELAVTEFTVEVWFKKTGPGVSTSTSNSTGIPEILPLVSKGRYQNDTAVNNVNFFLGIDVPTGTLAADFEDTINGTNHPLYANTVVTDNVWHHAAVTYEGGTWRMYLDGVLDAEQTLSESFTPSFMSIQHAGLATGMNSLGVAEGFFEGILDEARIWDYARSLEEIQAAMPYEVPFPFAGLLGRWGLNEGSGLTAADSSGQDVHGTLTNGPMWVAGHPFAPDTTAPDAPQGLNATPGEEAVSLTWTANAEPDVAGYNVYRDGGKVNSLPVTATSYTDTGLTNGQTYTYTVTAVDFGALESGPSSEATATPVNVTPGAPTGVNAGAGNGFVIVTWAANPEPDIAGYNVYRDSVKVNGALVTDLVYVDNGLTNGVLYSYTVTAVDTTPLESAPSAPAEATPVFANTALGLASNTYVDFGDPSKLGLAQFTLELWFKREGPGVADDTGVGGFVGIPLLTKGAGLLSEGSDFDINFYLGIRTSDNVLGADFEEGATGTQPGQNHPVFGVTPIPADGTWHHAAATYDADTWKLYLDGNLEATLVVGEPVRNDSIWRAALGTSLREDGITATGFFDGTVDEARIWSRPLSQAEILSNLNSPLTSGTDLVARWGFDDGIGDAVSDAVTAPANGTIVGGGHTWVAGAPFNLPINHPPSAPVLVGPADGATGVALPPALEVTVSDPDADALTVTYYGRLAGPTDTDFTVLALPGTPYYTNEASGGTAAMFTAQTQWAVDNQASANVAFVTHLGDVTDFNTDAEWQNADTSMSVLETVSGLPEGIPYGIVLGNWDDYPDTTFYNTYFGATRFAGRTYYGGAYGSDNDNHFELFSAGGLDFVIIHLEWADPQPTEVLDWADSVLKSYSSRRGIVVSHFVATATTPAVFGSQGQDIYDALKDNPNFFLLLGGHRSEAGRRTDTDAGHPIHTVVSSYDTRDNGGNGWMRIMEFSPSSNQIRVKTYSPVLDQFDLGSEHQFTLPYDMGGTSFAVIGTQTGVASGGTASFDWTGLSGGTYEWYVTVSDGSQTTTSPTWSFSTTAAPQTTLTVTPPSNGTITGPGINCGDGGSDCTEMYDSGTPVSLSATPAGGYEFLAWTGDCTGSTCDLTMDVDHTVGATFGVASSVGVSVDDVSLTEGDCGTSNMTFTVSLSSPSLSTVTVTYQTQDGTATQGEDYTLTSGMLTFDPGVTTQPINVPIIGETAFEGDETFTVQLTLATNATLVDDSGTGTILNDDIDPATGLEPVVWVKRAGVVACGPGLTKTTYEAWGNAGASSNRQIDGDGYVEFTVPADPGYAIFGLSSEDVDRSFADIDFAFYTYPGSGELMLFESGVYVSSLGPYSAGQKLRISLSSGTIAYSIDGAPLYTSSQTPSFTARGRHLPVLHRGQRATPLSAAPSATSPRSRLNPWRGPTARASPP